MKRFFSAMAMGITSLLAACEDASVITHVDKLSHMHLSDLVAMQDANGVPTEIHGLPFEGMTPEDVAGLLRPPASAAQETRFYAVPPGRAGQSHSGFRLVLHFNPIGPPNAVNDCRRLELAQTNPPQAKGFEVNATFCEGDAWQAHGFLKAPGVEAGDFPRFTDEMTALFLNIFREEKNR